MKEYGVGVIGFGFMGKAHTYAYRTIPFYYRNLPFRTKLVGVCSRNFDNARKARDEFGFEMAAASPEELFNRKDIHIINICTPNDSHKDLILGALKAGKHVYCDKPMTVNCDEALEILELVQSRPEIAELTTQVALHNRFFPAVMRARQMIEEGKIGKPLSFRASFLHSSSLDPEKPAGWRHADHSKGGGVLFDLGSHLFDMISFLLGEYRSLDVKTSILHAERPVKGGGTISVNVEDFFMAMAVMKNGAMGTLEGSKIATGIADELRVEIHGDLGALRFNLAQPGWLEFYDHTAPEEPFGGTRGFLRIECMQKYEEPGGVFPPPKLSVGWLRAHVHSLYNFLSCMDKGAQASPSLLEGAYTQYVMEKAFESDRLKNWVEL